MLQQVLEDKVSSLFAKYLEERTDDKIVETDRGFATYCFTKDNDCWIKDIYVLPAHREYGEASAIADSILEIAKKEGCRRVLGSVIPSTKGSTISLRVLLGYGMKLESSTNDFILFAKEIQ